MVEQSLMSLHEEVRGLDRPDCLKILNIDEGALELPTTTREYLERFRAWSQLRSIAGSIPDLLNQSDDIALVGFLGHFSSGKSSLINALLGVAVDQSPGYKRDVGQHPTDTRITLITHRDHAQLVKKSAYTAVDDIDVLHGPALEFLEHATLVDTPGLGNEAVEQDAVTRFLHLCHVLVITIDGRRPFADKDKDFELLDTAFNKLDGVPKILVVTSAEEFLTSRKASFSTGWQAEHAEAFWEEAIARLRKDSRFRDQLNGFQVKRPFFVDSKEGFRVDEVRDALLPIVTDESHRARIREAQGRYVLETAREALGVLLGYIGTRSKNLNRLRDEAQRRADGTATAVEEILESLEYAFSSVRQGLQEARQAVPMNVFSVEAIITSQTISQGHERTLGKVEDEVREKLQAEVGETHNATWRRLRRLSRARTRRWFRATGDVDVGMLLESQFDVGGDGTGLSSTAKAVAKATLRTVNQQLAASFASSIQHLRGRTEASEVGWSTGRIESSLDKFERVHDDGIRSFYAYISAPSSSELLKEHGFVGFDASGEQAIQTASIDALDSVGFNAILRASDSCKRKLRDLRREEDDDLDQSAETEEGWIIEDAVFGDDYCQQVAGEVNAVCQRRVDEFCSEVTGRVARFAEETGAERSKLGAAREKIWKARGGMTSRLVLVLSLLSIGLIVFVRAAPSTAQALWAALPDHLLETVVAGALSTVAVLGLVFVISGARNENTRSALRSVLVERWNSGRARRRLSMALKAHFDDSYDRLVADLGEMPLQMEHAMAKGIVQWLKGHSDAYQEAEGSLAELRKVIEARCVVFDEFIGVVNKHLKEIPKELRNSAAEIKRRTIEEYMSRIGEAASSVETVKSDIDRIAKITMRAG